MQSKVEVPTSSTQWKDQEIKARDADAEDYFDYCRRSLGPYGDRGQVKLVLRAVAPTRDARVLDAGCGVGRFALPLASQVRSILAVDYSSASIEVLQGELAKRGLTNVTTDVGDLTSMKLPPDTFDLAIAPGVIHHIPSAESRLKAMRNILSSLIPGGRLGVLVYRWGGNIRKSMPKEGMHASHIYYFAFTVEEARKMMEEAGYVDIRIRGFLSLPRRITARLPGWMSWLEPVVAQFPWSVLTSHSLLLFGRRPATS